MTPCPEEQEAGSPVVLRDALERVAEELARLFAQCLSLQEAVGAHAGGLEDTLARRLQELDEVTQIVGALAGHVGRLSEGKLGPVLFDPAELGRGLAPSDLAARLLRGARAEAAADAGEVDLF
ncbi:hypothetical protein [Parvularcula oceani]|uniref:hypothetical protein n=1 Tax=Parvularcula oceani TaxID=1247963 RepID=UPI0004E1880F|nr:hypothetical protein [Parvularcula oceani]